MKRRALLAVGVLSSVLLISAPARAATASVAIQGFGFSPQIVKVAQGDTVRWTQLDAGVRHTSTSNQGFWHSVRLSTNRTYSQTAAFQNAGGYPYHCAVHPDMTGRVRVPLNAHGSSANGWRVRWSSLASTPANRSFDVQLRRPGSTSWAAFRTDTKTRTAFFDPAKTGQYAFRARTDNRANGKESGWSPVRALAIT